MRTSTRHCRYFFGAMPLLAGFVCALSSHVALAQFATPGKFDVSPSGAAQYTIPIQVPPGTAGMTPSLALSYNSQGGNGLLGMGWSLSGLSAISRCPKTLIQDGTKSGVNYDATDKYCLDGQRLIAINGTYGANGTEYRTEREGFSKILSYGSSGSPASGPASFKVWTKAGQILEFGNTADSAIEAQGKTVIRIWAVNKITDTKGNYLTVSYTETNANGEYYPNRIDYTGNATASPALTPYNSVQFLYETRPDITPLYDGGSLIKSTQRLKNIKTYAKVRSTDTLTKDYRLTYDISTATLRSRLTTLTECDGQTTPVCLQPTGLGWETPTSPQGTFDFARRLPGASSATNSYLDFYKDVIAGDFNGDGKADILHLQPNANPQYSWVALSNGDGTFSFTRSLPGASSATNSYLDTFKDIVASDFNGDGKTDILHLQPNADPQYSWVGLSNGDGTFNFTRSLPGASAATNSYLDTSYQNITVGDFNGDGKADMLHLHPDGNSQYSWVALSNGDGTFSFTRSLPGASVATNSYLDMFHDIVSGDFNGDGKTDILHLQPNADPQYSWVGLSNGDGTFNFTRSLPGASSATNSYLDFYRDVIASDFNGDGKTDILHLQPNADPQYSWVALAQGTFPDFLTTLTPGLGASTAITYKPLTDGSVYTKDSGSNAAVYPVVDVQAPLYVVSSVSSSDGVGGNYLSHYTYTGAKSHLTGGGFLGFRVVTNTDPQTNISSRTTYLQTYPYQGLPTGMEKRLTTNNTLLNQVNNAWSFDGNAGWSAQYHLPKLTQSIESSYELTGSLISTVTTANTYDAYGNPTLITVSTPDGYSKTTTNTYTNDLTNWYLGRLTNATVSSTTPDTPTNNPSTPAPAAFALSSISPTIGALAGGTTITLTGVGFATGTTVTIGGVAATGCTVINSTSMTCVTPANSAGAKDVTVNRNGASATLVGSYTYHLPITATGGTVTTSGGYTIHTFTSSGTFQITSGSGSVEYLVVGGGGGGGFSRGGGGGAGGFLTGTTQSITAGNYAVVIGAGGTAGVSGARGGNGGDSSYAGQTAVGGGGGASNTVTAGSGGSGGGANPNSHTTVGSGVAGQGNPGSAGYFSIEAAGGGGGAGSSGTVSSSGVSGNGGVGRASSITGVAVTYAGGGGGGCNSTYGSSAIAGSGGAGGGGAGSCTGAGTSGSANTGGGGGGGKDASNGGPGSSGIVIIRYVTP